MLKIALFPGLVTIFPKTVPTVCTPLQMLEVNPHKPHLVLQVVRTLPPHLGFSCVANLKLINTP